MKLLVAPKREEKSILTDKTDWFIPNTLTNIYDYIYQVLLH
jgi:hypothetical protein